MISSDITELPDDLPPLRDVMAKYDLLPRKALGQNFLLDSNITDKIARSAGDLKGVNVIEVGPGPGGLTRSILCAGAAHVVVIEKDSRCVAALHELAEAVNGRLTVIEADAMKVDIASLIPAPRKLIANLPYNVATPLLIGWLKQIRQSPEIFQSMTLMFQKEVADRILATSEERSDYGRLAVMSQWLCQNTKRFDLPPSVFTPPPKVTSTVVHFIPREEPLANVPWHKMERVVEKAFGQRRKMLRSSLKGMAEDIEAILQKAEIEPTLRAENVTLAQFGVLASLL